MRFALYQPDIPGNTGSLLRIGACLGLEVHIIEPAGFVLDDKRLRRAGMDYTELAGLVRHQNWAHFIENAQSRGDRLVLLTTQGDTAYTDFAFSPEDTLLLGSESAGVPPEVHQAVDARIVIPMAIQARSLNVAVAAAMVAGEALRQTTGFPTS